MTDQSRDHAAAGVDTDAPDENTPDQDTPEHHAPEHHAPEQADDAGSTRAEDRATSTDSAQPGPGTVSEDEHSETEAPTDSDDSPDSSASSPSDEAEPSGTSEEVVLAEPHTSSAPSAPASSPSAAQESSPDFFDSLDQKLKSWWAQRQQRRAQKNAPPTEQQTTPAEGAAQPTAEGVTSTPSEPGPPAPGTGAEVSTGWEDATQILPPVPEEDHPGESDPSETAEGRVALPPPPRTRQQLDDDRQRHLIAQKAAAIEAATSGHQQPVRYESADDEEDLYTYIPPYNLPSRDPDPEPTTTDLARRIFVTLGAAAAVASVMWMLGWFGTESSILPGNGLNEQYSGGWFSGEYALLTPDHNVYWLWPVLALGLVAHAVFQWQPSQESTPRQRRSGWLVGSAALGMLVVTAGLYAGWITIVALASVAMALTLLEAIRQFNHYTARNRMERQLTDDVVGLFFGFALVQATSALSARLTSWGWDIPGIPSLLWAGLGLFLCVWTAAFYSMTERGRVTIALGLGWGMFWLVFPRVFGEVSSPWVAIGAAMSAFIVILATQSRRHRINHAELRAAMGRPLEDII
ncbi:DMT family transporter [Nesterenkonia alba]|uniref:DMT family transporter n=1 Tax=Nesterenkonia alba TaxID=515814 RepID=UPI0003B6FB8B|nr:DMT family transporter [Nesterenkonia alba]